MPVAIAQDNSRRPGTVFALDTLVTYALSLLRGSKFLHSYVRRTATVIAPAEDDLWRPHSLKLSTYSIAILGWVLACSGPRARWHAYC